MSLILITQASAASAASIMTEWLDQAVPYAHEVAWEPTVGSCFFATLHTAMYDAWTAYDPIAVGVVSGTALKGLGGANNEANKREAISHAAFAYRAILTRFKPGRLARVTIQDAGVMKMDQTASLRGFANTLR